MVAEPLFVDLTSSVSLNFPMAPQQNGNRSITETGLITVSIGIALSYILYLAMLHPNVRILLFFNFL